MTSKQPVAVKKARRQGTVKNFYITGPAGKVLADTLPKIDMVSRLFAELYAEQGLTRELYDEQRDLFYHYIEQVDEWVSSSAELLLRAGLLQNANPAFLKLYKKGIRKKKTMFLNTQTAVNAYYSFAKCDTVSCVMLLGLRQDAINAETYQKTAVKVFSMLDSLNKEIEEMRAFLWECRR